MQFPDIQVAGEGQLYARLKTTQGDVVILLEETRAPETVKNFVGPAARNSEWTDPVTGKKQPLGTPPYAGVELHRVSPGVMVQVGDPARRRESAKRQWGTGGAGYRFADEVHPELKDDKPGVLS